MICSKQFTDLNLRLFSHSVKNCCKTSDVDITIEDLDQHGPDVFKNHKTISSRRSALLYDKTLPSSCQYCIDGMPNSMRNVWNRWKEPDSDTERSEIFKKDYIDYIEIVSTTACDLACIYCNAENSSTWAKEIGVPIVKANQQWKEKLLENFYLYLEQKDFSHLRFVTFGFSGGEPTYNNETFELIENIVKRVKGKTKIRIDVTSNFNTKEKQMDKFIKLINSSPEIEWVWIASIDDLYERNDAIRFHSNFNTITKNLKRINDDSLAKIVLLPSINIFSLPYLCEYVDYFSNLLGKENYLKKWSIGQNVIYFPEYLSPRMLDSSYKEIIDSAILLSENLNPVLNNEPSHKQWIHHLNNIKQNLNKYNEEKWKLILKEFMTQRANMRKTDIVPLFPHVYKIIQETK
jgi:sulfatase maturation enzyme AslB (radical SAM superfamily)